MPINDFAIVDYLEEARSRVTTQFTQKDVFDRYLQLLLAAQVDLQRTYQELMQERSLDTARGRQLDIIGEIVGQARNLLLAEEADYFGFLDATGALPYSSLSDPASGGTWASLTVPTVGNILLDDETYRLVLKARILANVSRCTPEDVLYSIQFLLGTNTSTVTEVGNAHVILGLSRKLTKLENYLIKGGISAKGLIPIPAGVTVEYVEYSEVAGEGVFGFEEDPTALGFADLQVATMGYGDSYGEYYGGSDYGYTSVGGGIFARIT